MNRKSTDGYGYIYLLICLISMKEYVGQTIDIDGRWQGHCIRVDQGSKDCLHCAIRKYGKESFARIILRRCLISDLDEWEGYYIDKFDTMTPGGYNMTAGGDGCRLAGAGLAGRNKAIRAAWKDQPAKRKEHSEKLRAAFSDPTHRARRSVQRKLDWKNPAYRAKMSCRKSGMKGRHHTEEARSSLSEATKRWWARLSAEERRTATEKKAEGHRAAWLRKSVKERKAYSEACRAVWARRKAATKT